MNTRLQVEHPVTELRRPGDLDLVAAPAPGRGRRAAAVRPGRRDRRPGTRSRPGSTPRTRSTASCPRPGRASIVRWPAGARVDAALESGQVVSTAYDPMLGKVIVHGPDRETARRALVAALDETAILGLTTNIGFLRALAASDEFRDATIDTAWLDRGDASSRRRATSRGSSRPGPARCWSRSTSERPVPPDGWRLGRRLRRRSWSSSTRRCSVDRAAAGSATTRASTRCTSCWPSCTPSCSLVDGRRERAVVNVRAARGRGRAPRPALRLRAPGRLRRPRPSSATARSWPRCPAPSSTSGSTEGQAVAEGDVLGVMEAMKMELSLKAPFAGTVTAVDVAAGEQVALGARLFLVEPARRRRLMRTAHRRTGPGMPERVTIYEVGPRDGLQNESALVPTEVKAEFIRRLVAAGLPVVEATSFVHPKWVPQLADAAELMSRPRRPRAGTCRCWCPTSAAWTARSSWAAGTSRSSGRRPRPSRSATSTAASTSSSPCSSRPYAGRATPGSTSAPTSRCASATRGRATCPSSRSSRSASGSSTSAPASSASATPSASAPPATSSGCSAASSTRACPSTSSRCTSTTPTARRSPTPTPRWRRASPPSTPAPAASAAARTPRAPPATSPPRTWSGCCTASASRPASTSSRSSPPASGWPGSSDGPARRPWSGHSAYGFRAPTAQSGAMSRRRLPAHRCTEDGDDVPPGPARPQRHEPRRARRPLPEPVAAGQPAAVPLPGRARPARPGLGRRRPGTPRATGTRWSEAGTPQVGHGHRQPRDPRARATREHVARAVMADLGRQRGPRRLLRPRPRPAAAGGLAGEHQAGPQWTFRRFLRRCQAPGSPWFVRAFDLPGLPVLEHVGRRPDRPSGCTS